MQACLASHSILRMINFYSREFALRQWQRFERLCLEEPCLVASARGIGYSTAFKVYAWQCKQSFTSSELAALQASGLYITKNVTLNPIGKGCCIGMCIEFLSLYFNAGSPSDFDSIKALGTFFKRGASPSAVFMQNLYRRYLAPSAVADKKTMQIFEARLQAKEIAVCEEMMRNILAGNACQEEKNYATFLEMENLLASNAPVNYFHLLHRAKNALATLHHFQLLLPKVCQADCKGINNELKTINIGAYLISVPEHALVFLQHESNCALFDPARGTFFFEGEKNIQLKRVLAYWLSTKQKHTIMLYPAIRD